MKRILLITISALFAANSFAQTLVSFRAGYGVTQLTEGATTSASTYYGGVGVELPLWRHLVLQTSLFVTSKGGRLSDEYNNEKMISATNIGVSPLLAYRLNFLPRTNVIFKTGPFFSVSLGYEHYSVENYNYNNWTCESYQNIKVPKLDYGYSVGIDIEYRHWFIGAEYQRGLADYTKLLIAGDKPYIWNIETQSYIDNPDAIKLTDLRSSTVYFILGFRF